MKFVATCLGLSLALMTLPGQAASIKPGADPASDKACYGVPQMQADTLLTFLTAQVIAADLCDEITSRKASRKFFEENRQIRLTHRDEIRSRMAFYRAFMQEKGISEAAILDQKTRLALDMVDRMRLDKAQCSSFFDEMEQRRQSWPKLWNEVLSMVDQANQSYKACP
jgi:hypothetical protein